MSPDRTPLQPFLGPAGVALFGASAEPGTPGFGLLQNLKGGAFAERIHLISTRHSEIAGHPCHASLADIQARWRGFGAQLAVLYLAAEAKAGEDIRGF